VVDHVIEMIDEIIVVTTVITVRENVVGPKILTSKKAFKSKL
jgi:hypothetical protein